MTLASSLAPAGPRRASARDVAFVAHVLEMAGRGHLERGPWDLMFPGGNERRRALEYIAGEAAPSWCRFSQFHVIDLDGTPAAALCAFEPGAIGETSLATPLYETFAMLGWDEARTAAVGPLLTPYVACFPDMPAGTWIIENVGTRAEARRRGLVRELLETALAEGLARGCASAQISCLIGNDAAQRAYERAGFEVVEERRDPELERLLGAPGFSRLVRSLARPVAG
jgi:ribosomal protein S18 acetylase RimI-like enzyme